MIGSGTFVAESSPGTRLKGLDSPLTFEPESKAIRTRRIIPIGVIMPMGTGFMREFAQTFVEACRENGHEPVFCDGSAVIEDQLEQLHFLVQSGIRGLILYMATITLDWSKYSRWLRWLMEQPLVLMDGKAPDGLVADSVRTDNFQGAYDAVTHLINQGHKRIAHLTYPEYCELSVPDRREGYMRALRDWGLEKNALILSCEDLESVRWAVSRPPEERTTAFFCFGDEEAARVIKVVKECRLRVPEDVAVAGYDNTRLALHAEPPITSVDQRCGNMAKAAFQLLQSRMEALQKGEALAGRQVVIPPELVVRDSTKKASIPLEQAIHEAKR